LFISDRNFCTRNARKSIKGSKDSDSSLVSNETFSAILWPRPGNTRQNYPKTTSFMTSVAKNPHPPTKHFFSSTIF